MTIKSQKKPAMREEGSRKAKQAGGNSKSQPPRPQEGTGFKLKCSVGRRRKWTKRSRDREQHGAG